MPCTASLLALEKAVPTNLLRAGSTCGLGLDIFGVHILSLAARFSIAAKMITDTDLLLSHS